MALGQNGLSFGQKHNHPTTPTNQGIIMSAYPPPDLDKLFGYQAPIGDKVAAHKAITEAHQAALSALFVPAEPPTFDQITAACQRYAQVIVDVCPDTGDRAVAIRKCRLLRGTLNRAIISAKRDDERSAARFVLASDMAIAEIEIWANAAIAKG